MTVWDSKEGADAYDSSGVYKQLVDRVRSGFSKEPCFESLFDSKYHGTRLIIGLAGRGSVDDPVLAITIAHRNFGKSIVVTFQTMIGLTAYQYIIFPCFVFW
jgi:hypothetical protein